MPISRKVTNAIREAWPPGRAGDALLALIMLGAILRVVMIASLWPVNATIDDAYTFYAGTSPFEDTRHPAGYPLILTALGALTREVAVHVVIQHLTGLVAALLMFAATRRATGSQWAGLLPAGILLFNPDLIGLEHAIMSESWAVLTVSAALYATVRAFDEPLPATRWPLLAGIGFALTVMIRTQMLPMVAVAVLALLLAHPQPLREWRRSWRAPATTAITAVALLVSFAAGHAAFGYGFGLGPQSGWLLYGRAALFADCDRFTPPRGTEVLCDSRPQDERPRTFEYVYGESSPARAFGHPDTEEGIASNGPLGTWARRAIIAQPIDYAETVWKRWRDYWLPADDERVLDDLQLDFAGLSSNRGWTEPIEANLEVFYDEFEVSRFGAGLEIIRAARAVTRFNVPWLWVTTALTLVGLVIGTRRSRVAVLLFGGGGLLTMAEILAVGFYSGRYAMMVAGPMMAAAAVAFVELWRRRRQLEAEAEPAT